jgi:hypothetical protein
MQPRYARLRPCGSGGALLEYPQEEGAAQSGVKWSRGRDAYLQVRLG